MADTQPLIAVRIKDGIFVGNVSAAHDEDFLYVNKVTHIVNCAGAEVPDLFADSGIEYLTFPWKDTPGVVNTTVMFDSADRNIEQVVRFMDKAIENGDCVLVHSVYGLSRSAALVAAYFMVKYGWKVDNALSFLNMAHQEMNIKPHFLRQLRMFAKRHDVEADVFSLDVDDSNFALDNDQWMLRNTLLNGFTSDVQSKNELHSDCSARVALPELLYKNPAKRRRRLSFVDTRQGTAVGSTASTPVVNIKTWSNHHTDPNSDVGNFPGAAGPRAIRSSKPKAPIAARHGTPNTRPLESRPEVNAKGRQILPMRNDSVSKQAPQPQQAPLPHQHVVRAGGFPADATSVSPRLTPLGSVVPVQRSSGPQLYQEQPTGEPQSHHQPVVVQRGGQTTVVDIQRGRTLESHVTAHHNSSQLSSSQQQPPSQLQPRGGAQVSANMIRSPFALTSSSVPRNGSPLPQQRLQNRNNNFPSNTSNTNALQPVEATGLRGTARPPPVHEIRSSATGGGGGRAASPVGQPSTAAVALRRTNSPLANRNAAPQPSMSSQMMSSRGSSPRGSIPTYSQQTMQRRPSSPLSRGPQGMPLPNSTTGGPRMVTYSSASTIQQQRALSPSSRSTPLIASSGPLPRTSSPVQRPSSVVQRTTSPRGVQISRTSSPMRGSLADQYLGGGSQLPRTSSGQVAPSSASSVLRRGQPVQVAARRM
jgi:protein-tyrosine phosphatase